MLLRNGASEEYYYYIFNAQGDVIGILDSTGTQVVEYTYNAWGEILSVTGTSADTIGQKNPLRYRGYYYDAETGLYYLLSRYYDPETGRFLNADGYVSTGQGILGNNMFAYCGNNPVNRADPSGQGWVDLLSEIVNAVKYLIKNVVKAIIDNEAISTNNEAISTNEYLNESEMEKNATIVYNYLKLEGWSHNAICATLGNMQVESTINPGIYQKGGSAFGIVQWDPASKYINWAIENGYSTGSMSGQLEFLIYSIQPGRGEWFDNGKTYGYYMSSKDFICSNASVAHLTQTFLYSYERAGISHLDRRIKYAEYWSNYFS